jgi:LuxR family maltose regulon positive regulatory protein
VNAPEPIAFALPKIQPPRPRAGLIARPALEAALGDALRTHRLTLLQSPAGYGKTTALTRQIAAWPERWPLAWVSVDEDDEVDRFLGCLAAALDPWDLPWRVAPDVLPMLAAADGGLREATGQVVNALAGADCERGLIVVDDLHRVADPRVHQWLAQLVERLPPAWGLVIASRTEPGLPLARLRAAGDLAEFRLHELRFSQGEVERLLRAHGIDAQAAGDLHDRTEGWAAGLRLMLSAGQRTRAGAGGQRHVFDYLASEVLAGMRDELRIFLLRCAVLPELTAARCAQVSAMPNAAALLDEVDRLGLFVSTIDAAETTLKLHDLFRDFLEDRLQREHPDELAPLLQRAAADEPDLARRVGYLARAGAWDAATQVLELAGPKLAADGGWAALERLLSLFPPHETAARPELRFLRGLAAYPRFDFDTMVRELEPAARDLAAKGRPEFAAWARIYLAAAMFNTGRRDEARVLLAQTRAQPLQRRQRIMVAYFGAFDALSRDDPADIAPRFAEALDGLEQLGDPVLWNACFFQSPLVGTPGMRVVLERFDAGAMRFAGQTPGLLRAGVLNSRMARAVETGDVPAARHWLRLADEDTAWLGHPHALLVEHLIYAIVVHALAGDRAAAEASAAHARREIDNASRSERLTHGHESVFSELRMRWLLGDDTLLPAVADDLDRLRNPFEWHYADSQRVIARALIDLAQDRPAQAAERLAPLARTDENWSGLASAQVVMLLAEAQRRLGRLDAAAATLQPWLDAAAATGAIGGALIAGRRVLDPLAAAPWGARLSPAARTLLNALPARLQPLPAADDNDTPLPGGLTERELDVLRRMAAGDSNKVIARDLDLSPFTVKRHVANILDKLGLASRSQAAAWLHAQGLAR